MANNPTPNASYSLTLRVKIQNRPGKLGEITTAIGRVGGDIEGIDIVSVGKDFLIRDITVNAASEAHDQEIVNAVQNIDGVEVVHTSDRTFLMHLGGKIETVSKMPLKTRSDLSMAYTPGVARVCEAIAKDPEKAFTLTIKKKHRRGYLRRHGGFRFGRHRSGGGDARNGRQMSIVQGIRRR